MASCEWKKASNIQCRWLSTFQSTCGVADRWNCSMIIWNWYLPAKFERFCITKHSHVMFYIIFCKHLSSPAAAEFHVVMGEKKKKNHSWPVKKTRSSLWCDVFVKMFSKLDFKMFFPVNEIWIIFSFIHLYVTNSCKRICPFIHSCAP